MYSLACQEKDILISTEIDDCVKILSVEIEAKTNFGKWLDDEIRRRPGWTRNKLSTEAKLGSGTLTNIFSGNKGVGKSVCKKIAKALDIPEYIVFQEAGLIKKAPNYDDLTQTIILKVSQMDNLDKQDVLDYADMVLRRRPKRDPINEFFVRAESYSDEELRDAAQKLFARLKASSGRSQNAT